MSPFSQSSLVFSTQKSRDFSSHFLKRWLFLSLDSYTGDKCCLVILVTYGPQSQSLVSSSPSVREMPHKHEFLLQGSTNWTLERKIPKIGGTKETGVFSCHRKENFCCQSTNSLQCLFSFGPHWWAEAIWLTTLQNLPPQHWGCECALWHATLLHRFYGGNTVPGSHQAVDLLIRPCLQPLGYISKDHSQMRLW